MYAQLTENEIKTLSEHRASGGAWAVYTALAAHAWKKAEVFPSIKRIYDVLGGHYTRRTIYAALKFLDKVGLIVRKAATVKERFTLALKKVKKLKKWGSEQRLQDPAQECKELQHKRKQKRKKNLRFSNWAPTAAQKDFKSMNQEHRSSGLDWLDKAAAFCFGETETIPIPKCKRKAAEALNSPVNAVACMFGDMIRQRLGHLLV